MRNIYRFKLATGGGSYYTDVATTEEAQAELSQFFLRPVVVWAADDSKKSPDRSGAKSSPGEGEAGDLF